MIRFSEVPVVFLMKKRSYRCYPSRNAHGERGETLRDSQTQKSDISSSEPTVFLTPAAIFMH